MSDVSRETVAEANAKERWPAAFDQLKRYHQWLCIAGVERGLVGPREIDRMWERHINNSAVLEELVPHDVSVIDVGSGAGLPGIPLAIVRPDLKITLLEPLARRVDYLNEVIEDLGLSDRVEVVRGRAEDPITKNLSADVVTGRAVASLGKLITWCWPLVQAGGQILMIKGQSAAEEIEESSSVLRRKKLAVTLLQAGAGVVEPQTTVVRIVKITSP
jgi:16S rRNA (guanine527-N7)-methyltransferase